MKIIVRQTLFYGLKRGTKLEEVVSGNALFALH
ncbi:hypothetical protein Paes_0692 [Prosthecochloris aestuarii DSM 271]|uniref:Uncharacterized protein n=1 Tax=Prosthecochloris aestuarii (strain DSM 271 / SK 413) TaxID=290512 RepID=B4S6I4_PROA2|nr:hypothetical protein Paes_0692 [Prosthecochloris aestuarii DSM 271]